MQRLQFAENIYGERISGFYMEEVDYSNLACLKFLNDSMPRWSDIGSGPDMDYKLTALINPGSYQAHLHSNYYMPAYGEYIDSVKPPVFMTVRYNATGDLRSTIPLPDNISVSISSSYPSGLQTELSNIHNTGIRFVGNSAYNNWLNDTSLAQTSNDMNYFNDLCNSKSIDMYVIPQVIFWHMKSSDFWMREPMNSEIGATIGIALCYGAKGILPYAYESFYDSGTPYIFGGSGIHYSNDNNSAYTYNVSLGISEFSSSDAWGKYKRTSNFYGEQKWSYLADLYEKIDKWGPILANSIYTSGYSVSRDGANHEYIDDIKSIYRNPSSPFEFNSANEDSVKFWEMGFFDLGLDGDYNRYFMMVNRRCVPDISNDGDLRQLKVKFNGSQLINFQNWTVFDMSTNQAVVTFPKNSTSYYDFGTFQPGESKLYRLSPTFVKGGTLVADEDLSGMSFTCEAPVYNNGHNITIGANTTIHFNDSSKFVMDGGVFTVGDQNISAPQNITSDAVSGSSWRGHSFTNCEVKIYGATFTGLANDTTYAVNIIDCAVVDIRNSTFNTNSSLKGGVNAVFFSDPNNEISLSNIYIGANTFNSSGSTIPTVNISSYAGETTPLIIENNTFNEGNTAIFLSGITGGAIKGNSITDNFIGINALTSSIDIKSNTISSTVNNAIGIFAAGGSELKMNNAGSKTLGGLNDLSNSGTAANNIVVDGSVFLLDGGENIFNITDDQSSKHLYGYFPQFTQGPFDETDNCFKLNSSPVDPPYNLVTSGFQGSQITFNFTPYLSGCEANEGGDGFAINLGDGIYDTIYNEGSGSGGSNKQIPLSRGVTAEGSRGVFIITTAKVKYDSISVLMRYRNYAQARTKCLDLLNTYPDSIQSLNAVSKLFLSTVASDTSYNAVNELKTYYENLILNNSGNVSLVKRANYYILKCKVRMREYSQALAGFQQIINQNPYSYEGLIARWDYMATSLLIQGQGGSYSSINNDQLAMSNYDIDGNDDDRSPFTKEQRQDIRKSINTAIELTKDEDDRRIKTLEVKSEQGDVNASKELSQMLTLKQVIKTDKPKSITEHVRIVSEDIRKVFGSNTSSKGNEPKNIPLIFRLSQNYPNPFNPVTKINYDLPKDSKVNIVIYDILGREVKRLVNSELKTAGSYIVDFNASNYASGVYFYRIEAEESNGNKFVDSKKMVLLK
jgi:tetratricopeptide (TPR) repeat protein